MPSGLLFMDKPAGMTSRDIDNKIQRLFHTRRVGHLGTLDPFATGLLIVAVNEATKYLPYLPDEEKTYIAELVLGKKTDTGDYTGNVVEESPIPSLTHERVKEVLASMVGSMEQLPPMTSAIKVDGVALYELAHKGIEVERKKRPIFIHSLSLLSLDKEKLSFVATVSKGTYIRTLGEDIAERLGTVGHLSALRRIKVGQMDLTHSVTLEEVGEKDLREPSAFIEYPRIELREEDSRKARNGVKLNFDASSDRLLLLFEGKALAIYERQEGTLFRCLRGL